ncbi:MAG TPA: sigma-70 family RNA polymerase sigma factor [Mycobacteriales bacterium]|jgi:RNA polymerase sigma-70 factor (ECF subfamily)|nr:sigma-70 family RNA polymerase sigma factor [Mycobacteriales bacterium]
MRRGRSTARIGTDEVLRTLQDEHGAALLAYATSLTGGDRQRAEDVVQETLVRAWQHLAELQADERSPRPWLFTVARNLAVDGHRARRARPTEVGEQALAVLAAPDELDRALQSWLVADALATLSAAHREVLIETYYRGRSVGEASVVLRIPPGTVKSRAYYALRALRVALEERGVEL